MQKLQVKYYQDAGHGWLAVKRKMLTELNLSNEITGYSYQKGQTVYLEEDYDAYIFVRACKNRGIEVVPLNKYCNRSAIRSYESYRSGYFPED
jgi:hypothetical protein